MRRSATLLVAGASSLVGLAAAEDASPTAAKVEAKPGAPGGPATRTAARPADSVRGAAPQAAAPVGATWPGFRGAGDSRSGLSNLPLTWNKDDGQAKPLAWKAPLPGYGQSSPVVWGERVFVTSAVGKEKEKLAVLAFDLASGKELWNQEIEASVKIEATEMVSRAAPTPAVDAAGVYVFFESGDLAAFDHDGKTLWKRSLTAEYGPVKGNHGLGSSPVQTAGTLILQVDHDGPSYLLAVDKATGKNVWKRERPSKVSWCSPALCSAGGKETLVTSGGGRADGYDPATGEPLWHVLGLGGNNVPSPTPAGDLVLIASTELASNIAISLGGSGDVTATAVKWKSAEALSSFGSPLVYEGLAYYVNRAGVLYCVDLADGKTLWKERAGASCWASPLGAEGRIYCFDKDGGTSVYQAGRELKPLAKNSLDLGGRVYGVAATPRGFVIRTGSNLGLLTQAPAK